MLLNNTKVGLSSWKSASHHLESGHGTQCTYMTKIKSSPEALLEEISIRTYNRKTIKTVEKLFLGIIQFVKFIYALTLQNKIQKNYIFYNDFFVLLIITIIFIMVGSIS